MFAFLASQSQSVTVTIEISTDLSTQYTTTSDSPTEIFLTGFLEVLVLVLATTLLLSRHKCGQFLKCITQLYLSAVLLSCISEVYF